MGTLVTFALTDGVAVITMDDGKANAMSIALQQENKLEAMRGLLRCQYKTQQFVQAVPNATELLLQKSIIVNETERVFEVKIPLNKVS